MTAISYNAAAPLPPLLRLASLTLTLLWRFWPQLLALWLIGMIADAVITEVAVQIGVINSLAGLSTLSLAVLTKLVIIVALFQTVRPGLPALETASRLADREQPEGNEATGTTSFTSALALTLVPFFAYYAAWGFLGDTVREYSKLALNLMPFNGNLLDVHGGAWLAASVLVAWIVRRFAKFMHKRSKAAIWPIVIVVCEANWAFIGLYVISYWKDDVRDWVAALPEFVGRLLGVLDPVSPASAATTLPPPAEDVAVSFSQQLINLFFYGLYPVVWLTLAALVYGYDINGNQPPGQGRLARMVSRWQSLPKSIRDFIAHFVAGTAKRYRALAEGVGLTLSSGLALILSVIVLFRLLDWGAAWAWYGAAHLIGPHDLPLWQVLAQGLSVLFGIPSAPGDGILIMPIKICLLAAALEIGFAGGRKWLRKNG